MTITSVLRRLSRRISGAVGPPRPPDVASIYASDVAGVHLDRMVEVVPGRRLVSVSAHADPVEVTRVVAPKSAMWLRDVRVWPEFSIATTAKHELLAETLPSPFRLLKMMRTEPFQRAVSDGRADASIRKLPFCAAIGSGYWYSNYYHNLIDELPRAYALSRMDMDGEDIVLFVPSYWRPEFVALLQRLTPDHVEVRQVRDPWSRIHAERYLFLPMVTDDYCGYLPEGFRAWLFSGLQDVIGAASGGGKRRIYVSREGARNRRVLNEDAVRAALEARGFETCIPGALSFDEQVRTFAEAEAIVGAHGAGLTNMLFSPACTVVELFPAAPMMHYRWLSESLGHSYRCVVPAQPGASKNSDFAVSVDAMLKTISDLR